MAQQGNSKPRSRQNTHSGASGAGNNVPATAMKAIRQRCASCRIGHAESCRIPECPLWEFRFGMRPSTAQASGLLPADRELGGNSPLKAIRTHCKECMGGNYAEVTRCPSATCPLWVFRFGMNPGPARKRGKPVDMEANTDGN